MSEQRLITNDDRVFQNPSEETIKGIAFGILWENDIQGEHKVISVFNWSIVLLDGRLSLRDSRGETRPKIAFHAVHDAIKFPSWESYDAHIMRLENERMKCLIQEYEKRIESLQSTLSKMDDAIRWAYDINEDRGPHSRKKVKEKLWSFVNCCSEHGRAIFCPCNPDELLF